MDVPSSPPESTVPGDKGPPRRRRRRAASDALPNLQPTIANWPAAVGWRCAMFGIIPIVGLPLGIMATTLGLLGYWRVRRKPADLGKRHAIGALIFGPIEIVVNVAGIACIVQGVMELMQ